MNLYIKISNGKPVDHPYLEDNMKTAYPEIDLNNLPSDWAKFIRVPQPKVGPYEVTECFYEWDDDVVKDVWYIYPMSDEEKLAKQNRVKKTWAEDGCPANWIFDEETCTHIPPVPMPQDGKPYIWVQQALQWVEMPLPVVPAHDRPPYPTDGKLYDYDESKKQWIARP